MTTTSAQIRDRMLSLIEAIVPTTDPRTRFRRHLEEVDFRLWGDGNAAGALRRFSVRDLGDYRPPIVSNTDVELRRAIFEVVVAYPLNGRFGRQLLGTEDVIDQDMHLIEGAVGMRGYGNFTSANAPAAWVDGESARVSATAVRFLVLRQTMEFYRSMT